MNYKILGTAGHIDHGKSTLIKALTGFWGDETKEEQRRGITIDLSFSYLKEAGQTVGFIDVPGHEKLTSTMISGAFGFDGSLIVIDVNEGIMPQTKEHLHVLNFLNIKECIVALNKCDLASDEVIKKQKEAVEEEFKNYKNLHVFSILTCSKNDEKSIQNLKRVILDLPKVVHGQKGVLRYFIDRAFNIKGHGVVVTGTLLDGEISEGQKVWICEAQKSCEVKSLQVHEKRVHEVNERQRVAINLNKIKLETLKKGMLISQKGYMRGFKNIDIYVDFIPEKIVPHNADVALHLGSKKVNGKLMHMEMGGDFKGGFCAFMAKEKIYSIFEDRFIISHKGEVVGGGSVVNPINDPIKKRFKLPILQALKRGDFKEAFLLLSCIHKRGFGLISAYQRFGLSHDKSLEYLENEDGVFMDREVLTIYPKEAIQRVEEMILAIYEKNPYALISEKSLNIKHRWISEKLALKALQNLKSQEKIEPLKGVWIKKGLDTKNLEKNIEEKIFSHLKKGETSPLAPYNIYDLLDIDRKTGDNALKSLTKSKKVVRLEHNFFVTSEVLSGVMNLCREIIKNDGFVDIKNLKSKLPLSRKYLIAYLEYLDKFDDILKDGMKRILR